MAIPRIILIVLVLNTLVLMGSVALNFYLIDGASQRMTGFSSSAAQGTAAAASREFQFFPIEKIIVNLRDNNREHYFVLDLVLQADLTVERRRLEQIDPIVRNSVVAYLSALNFQELREMPIGELQGRLQEVVLADVASRNLGSLFSHVLVSKMLVQ